MKHEQIDISLILRSELYGLTEKGLSVKLWEKIHSKLWAKLEKQIGHLIVKSFRDYYQAGQPAIEIFITIGHGW